MTMDTSQYRAGAEAIMAALAVDSPPTGGIPPIQAGRRWQWLHGRGELDLFVKDVRASDRSDIDDRLAVLSCGAELHRMIVELAAAGWTAAVTRQPYRAFPFHLATVRITPRPAVHESAPRQPPRPDQPGEQARPGGADNLWALSSAIERAGGELTLLSAAQVPDLLAVTIRGDRPADVASSRRPLPPAENGGPPEQHAVFAILHGRDDRPSSWLHAGEAFGAGCLAAADRKVSIQPLTDAIRDADAREKIRRVVPGEGFPYLILRVSSPASTSPAGSGAPPTSRRHSGR